MTTEELLSFEEYLDEAPEDASVEEGPTLPHLTWRYGNPANSRIKALDDQTPSIGYTGGWFLGADTADTFGIDEEALDAAGFVKDLIVLDNGDEIEGYSAQTIYVQRIHMRRRWSTDDGFMNWNEGFDYTGSKRPQLHVLVLIQGLEEYGPFFLTMKGSAEMSWFGAAMFKGQGVEETLRSTLLASANRLVAKARKAAGKPKSKKSYHYMAFCAPVGVKWVTNGKGKAAKETPEFVEVGLGDKTKMVVVPQVVTDADLTNQMDSDALRAFMVPKDLFFKASELFEEYREWAAAWDSTEDMNSFAEGTDADAEEAKPQIQEPDEVELEDMDL